MTEIVHTKFELKEGSRSQYIQRIMNSWEFEHLIDHSSRHREMTSSAAKGYLNTPPKKRKEKEKKKDNMAINHVFWTITTTSTSKVTLQVSYPSFILLIRNHLKTRQITIWSCQHCLSSPPLDTSITAQSKPNAWWSGTCHIMHRGTPLYLWPPPSWTFPWPSPAQQGVKDDKANK